jgi:ABC-type sugar transport system substrate-binding protein
MHKFRWVLVMGAVAMLVAGCGRGRDEEGGSGGSQEKTTIAVFLSNGGDPYFQNKSYGYKKAERELGNAEVEIFDAGGYENVEKQIAQIEDAVQRNVDAIVLTPTDSSAVCGPIQEALDAGIPVVADDIMPTCDDVTVPAGISENSVNVGRNECEYMAEQIGGKGNFVMLKGPPGAKIAIDRVNGCKEALRKYPDIKIVAEQWGPSNIETGNKLMDDFLSAHGRDIDAAFTFGAITALGAVDALQSAKYKPGDVSIATIDYHPEVLAEMKQRWIAGTIPAQPVRLAELTTTAAYNLANKKPVEGEKGVDKCCDVRAYTSDEEVIDNEKLPSYDASNAVAPEGWKPPLQS